jgi:hypothetical protein
MPMVDGDLVWWPRHLEIRVAVLPREEVTFTDGWHVQGLKGTGSYDYEVEDTFVPARTFGLFDRAPQRGPRQPSTSAGSRSPQPGARGRCRRQHARRHP